MRTDDDAQHAHRHAYHAFEDFERLRKRRDDERLWHSLSHHLRHTVFRTGLEVSSRMRHAVRRHGKIRE
jgi:hypothetical protein